MSDDPTQPQAGPVWCFVLEPAARLPDGSDAGPLPERLADAVRAAEARGFALAAVRVAFVAIPSGVPGEVRVRGWLKRVLRDHGLKARWPVEKPAAGGRKTR